MLVVRVLVCGGRLYGATNLAKQPPAQAPQTPLFRTPEYGPSLERNALYAILDAEHRARPFEVLIHGAARGADQLAGEWAKSRGVSLDVYPADWDKHGRSAGPIRNGRMLVDGKPDMVIAFPGGKGTADMVRQARRAGIATVLIGSP